jgi:histidinol-phosphatase (PHP family)
VLDYHVHLWPHEQVAEEAELRLDRLGRYVATAAEHGVEEIALTEHLFRFDAVRGVAKEFWRNDPNRELGGMMAAYFDHHATVDLDRYVEAVLEAKDAGLPVVLGLEVDYYPGRMDAVARLVEGYPFDVLLGSVHWLGAWGFDMLEGPALTEWDHRAARDVWKAYTAALEELAGTGTCDVLAHPDLVKLVGRYPDPGLVAECHERIADAAATNGLAAEVSSAGWRKPVGEAYPAPDLLRRFFVRGVPITFASDAHGSGGVAQRSEDLATLARSAGYGSLRGFRRRQGIDLPIDSRPPVSGAVVG